MGIKIKNFFPDDHVNPESNIINSITNEYNLEPLNLVKFCSSLNKTEYKGEDIFIINKKYDDGKIELLSSINLEKYFIESKYTNGISNIEIHDIIYLKNYLSEKGNNIKCDNLAIIRKATDFDIFIL